MIAVLFATTSYSQEKKAEETKNEATKKEKTPATGQQKSSRELIAIIQRLKREIAAKESTNPRLSLQQNGGANKTVWNMPILVDDGSVKYSGLLSPMGEQPSKTPVSTSILTTPNIIIQRSNRNTENSSSL